MLRNLLFNVKMSIRMWTRNRSRPVTLMEAEERRLFWAKVYMICGGLTFLAVSTITLLDSSSTNFSSSIPVHNKLIENMNDEKKFRVIKYSGFTKESDIIISKKEAYDMRDAELNIRTADSEKINDKL